MPRISELLRLALKIDSVFGTNLRQIAQTSTI
jgi:hypothetical protein